MRIFMWYLRRFVDVLGELPVLGLSDLMDSDQAAERLKVWMES